MSINKWIQKNTVSLSGKTVAISGSTGGLGRALCKRLSDLGASLVLMDRSRKKMQALTDELLQKHPELSVKHIILDLEDVKSVKSVTAWLYGNPPDFLILNAGIYHVPRCKCECGFNNVFQVNFLSPYYMARKLKDVMRERGGRIIATGSIAHRYSHIDTADIDFSSRKASSRVYGNSKRFLMFALHGLYNGDDGMTIAHPGITFTNITSHYPKVIFAIIKHPMKVIFMRTDKACLSTLAAMLGECKINMWYGPCLFDVWGLPKQKTLKGCKSDEAQAICNIADRAYAKMDRI